MKRHPTILKKEKTGLLIIDIQEKISAVMKYQDSVIENTVKLVKGFQVLQLPIFITEQYRKGLGPTAAPILEALQPEKIEEKLTFSCCTLPNFGDQLKNRGVEQVVICGIEAHVCVAQTALDLLANDFQVYLAADAVSSRKKIDHKMALERLRQQGAIVTTAEAVLFELLVESRTPEFKEISKIVK
ncbi:MAG: hydrolase [Calditrichaeota bacterium]|nr:hydrolase [Calditrichota bacterium]